MKKLIVTTFFILSILTAGPAAAVTIKNTCDFPVAGSLRYQETKVIFAQFRLIPGQKIHLGKGISDNKLILRTIPDAGIEKAAPITTTTLDSSDCYIELKHTNNGIETSID
ncbi:hypothetical protein SAMN05660337_1516 [Maridesulfovibrio ferrireducens]|uniref:Uncharacterized protein n=1 Tax=Maridesulfovibrio ferrireducens TaxID=246191 RepID=A0A1G9FF84_9BACT|nr:hypothetical protein [Maridesulfovibrio ferrireducens]SDK87030.1 hypothetical protein SAMN05660337_1516 [Maridesulfovibrio ferrireducens]